MSLFMNLSSRCSLRRLAGGSMSVHSCSASRTRLVRAARSTYMYNQTRDRPGVGLYDTCIYMYMYMYMNV